MLPAKFPPETPIRNQNSTKYGPINTCSILSNQKVLNNYRYSKIDVHSTNNKKSQKKEKIAKTRSTRTIRPIGKNGEERDLELNANKAAPPVSPYRREGFTGLLDMAANLNRLMMRLLYTYTILLFHKNQVSQSSP